MSTEVSEKLYTVEEFLNLDLPEEEDYELIGGRIVARQGTTSGLHGDIAGRISTALNLFAGSNAGPNRVGRVFVGSSTNLGKPQGKFFPKPDVSFVLLERLPAQFEEIPVAPDIVVEVDSPTDTDERRFEKLHAYQAAGVRLIWSVSMLGRYILVYRLDNPDISLLNLKDELDGGDVIPGFSLKVSELFS